MLFFQLPQFAVLSVPELADICASLDLLTDPLALGRIGVRVDRLLRSISSSHFPLAAGADLPTATTAALWVALLAFITSHTTSLHSYECQRQPCAHQLFISAQLGTIGGKGPATPQTLYIP